MTQRTVIESHSGARVGISAVLPATFDVAGYDVSSLVFTPIGQVESYGNHGLSAAVTEFTPVDTGDGRQGQGFQELRDHVARDRQPAERRRPGDPEDRLGISPRTTPSRSAIRTTSSTTST
jgi:hypothetical protein